MSNKAADTNLWTPRSVEDTQTLYASWADRYDADMARMAYATPTRIADALAATGLAQDTPVLDFGCGTGLSGVALARAGFTAIDGCDISEDMLAHARTKGVYRKMISATPGSVPHGPYGAIIATGVVSLGAAPPDMLDVLLRALPKGGYLAFSFNDPTLADPAYTAALSSALAAKDITLVSRAHGPHLNETVTGSDVIVLRIA